jgi:ribosomal protein S18 acetylase RimI-like enzyme
MNIKFTTAAEKDIPDILLMMEEFNSIDNYPFDKAGTKANLLQFLSDQSLGRAWTINFESLTIGYIVLAFGFSFEHDGRDAFIDELFLKSEFRKKGIGKLAMDFVWEEAQRLGINAVHLEVEQHNEAGSKLYREKGYEDNGRILLTKKMNHKK